MFRTSHSGQSTILTRLEERDAASRVRPRTRILFDERLRVAPHSEKPTARRVRCFRQRPGATPPHNEKTASNTRSGRLTPFSVCRLLKRTKARRRKTARWPVVREKNVFVKARFTSLFSHTPSSWGKSKGKNRLYTRRRNAPRQPESRVFEKR